MGRSVLRDYSGNCFAARSDLLRFIKKGYHALRSVIAILCCSKLNNCLCHAAGGLFLYQSCVRPGPSESCADPGKISLNSIALSNNRAYEGGGGALFWTGMDNLNIICHDGNLQKRSIVYKEEVPIACSEWVNNTQDVRAYGSNGIASTAFYVEVRIIPSG